MVIDMNVHSVQICKKSQSNTEIRDGGLETSLGVETSLGLETCLKTCLET